MKELHQAERCAPAYKDTKISFVKKVLDKENARRIMPLVTSYQLPVTSYQLPVTCIKARCRATSFYASSFAGAAGETREHTAFITRIPEDAYLSLKARCKRRGSALRALPRDEFAVPQTRRAYSFLIHIPEIVFISAKTRGLRVHTARMYPDVPCVKGGRDNMYTFY
ncbi:hypothetical protein H0R92_07090 [Treponema sp. OMZ 840]|uniref:hypothetical protein n=1 Tax=Treponema sp. OMZ 840 TaxID=244313 RepID=UPI003D8D2DD6